MQKKITVCLAAFHGENYIKEQLASLLNQHRRPDEILIGDDSPDDKTGEAVAEFITDHSCGDLIRYRKNPLRMGITGNFGALIADASGDYIFLCDQDDVWLPSKIEQMTAMLDSPAYDCVFCNSLVVDDTLASQGYSTSDIVHLTPAIVDRINLGTGTLDILRTPPAYGHNMAFKAEMRKYILPMPLLQSYDLYITLLAAGLGRIGCINKNLTFFRRHGCNQSAQETGMLARINRLCNRKKAREEIAVSEMHIRAAADRLAASTAEHLPEIYGSKKYYNRRLNLQAMPYLFRPISILSSLPEYYRYGSGLKSILRDFIF